MGILALIAEFENDIRRERQMDGIAKAKERGTRFGRKPDLTPEKIAEIKALRADGTTVPEIIRRVGSVRPVCIARWGTRACTHKSVDWFPRMSASLPIADVRRACLKSPLSAMCGRLQVGKSNVTDRLNIPWAVGAPLTNPWRRLLVSPVGLALLGGTLLAVFC